jgi:hypothetical protein
MSKMTAFGSAQPVERDASKDETLSPELREVLHMLQAIEQGAVNTKQGK